jgi:hypothetical protein
MKKLDPNQVIEAMKGFRYQTIVNGVTETILTNTHAKV